MSNSPLKTSRHIEYITVSFSWWWKLSDLVCLPLVHSWSWDLPSLSSQESLFGPLVLDFYYQYPLTFLVFFLDTLLEHILQELPEIQCSDNKCIKTLQLEHDFSLPSYLKNNLNVCSIVVSKFSSEFWSHCPTVFTVLQLRSLKPFLFLTCYFFSLGGDLYSFIFHIH